MERLSDARLAKIIAEGGGDCDCNSCNMASELRQLRQVLRLALRIPDGATYKVEDGKVVVSNGGRVAISWSAP